MDLFFYEHFMADLPLHVLKSVAVTFSRLCYCAYPFHVQCSMFHGDTNLMNKIKLK